MDWAESHQQIRAAVRDLCARFPGEYWRENEVFLINLEVPAENLLRLPRWH